MALGTITPRGFLMFNARSISFAILTSLAGVACSAAPVTSSSPAAAEAARTNTSRVVCYAINEDGTAAAWAYEVVAGNGKSVLTSQTNFTTAAACDKSASQLVSDVKNDNLTFKTKKVDGHTIVQVMAENDDLIAESNTQYASSEDAEGAVDGYKSAISNAKVEKAAGLGVVISGVSFEEDGQQYFFSIRAANGRTVFSSDQYATHATAIRGAKNLLGHQSAGEYKIKSDANGNYTFSITLAGQSTVTHTSNNYKSEKDAKAGRTAYLKAIKTLDDQGEDLEIQDLVGTSGE
jgi:uncharacterized protein YegP (UPF0339 family)